ncbi:hypothetical protein [Bosea sp. (in: a-proteobacteria)]|uniref:hypothetical protein n=1 Tax=Bosea sp. (in: a-proteobacteria) TaxID=1871050 RepID=UPI004033BDF2
MATDRTLIPFPRKADQPPIPRSRADVVRLLAANLQSLGKLAVQIAATDIDRSEQLRLLNVVGKLVADTGAEILKLEEDGVGNEALIPQIKVLVERLRQADSQKSS